jgi:hypothetical protein
VPYKGTATDLIRADAARPPRRSIRVERDT